MPLARRGSRHHDVAPPVAALPPQQVSAPAAPSAPLRLLLVCTGNICRSAAAERLARHALGELLGDSAELVRVTSAGTRAVVGSDMHPFSAAVVRDLGADPGDFAARQLRAPMVVDADLVLTMTRQHREVVFGLDPRALSRTFTLREAADLARMTEEAGGDGSGDAGRTLVQRMAMARRHRRGAEEDDIRDPIDGPAEVHREVVEDLAELLRLLLRPLVQDLAERGELPTVPRTQR
jgi:protein-tyrosine phosphatase